MEKKKSSRVFGRRVLVALMMLVLTLGLMACGSSNEGTTAVGADTQKAGEADTQSASELDTQKASEADTQGTSESDTQGAGEADTQNTETPVSEDVTIRVGSLKGPTTMGLVNLMKASEDGTAKGTYEFRMETQPDVIAAAFASGELDIALVPANLGATLYKKTEGKIGVALRVWRTKLETFCACS